MDINLAIARNVKRTREEKRLTLDTAAALTGVSRSMLVQIEKGAVNPTISVLWKIANGYKVSFSTLLDHTGEGERFLPCAEPMTEDGGRYRNYPTFSFDERRHFEMYRIVIDEGGRLEAQPHLAGSEEYVTVFQGTVEITLMENRYVLGPGDSLRFRADQGHGYGNAGTGEAWMSMLIYYAD